VKSAFSVTKLVKKPLLFNMASTKKCTAAVAAAADAAAAAAVIAQCLLHTLY